jgi:hypothetical protein
MTYTPCSTCRRHVRADEARCPFCGASIGSASARRDLRSAGARATRYAVGVAFAALGGASCSAGTELADGGVDGGRDVGTGAQCLIFAPLPGDDASAEAGDAGAADGDASPDDASMEAAADATPDAPVFIPPRHSCSCDDQGRLVCPPYGCVFPDEACDVVRA